ncbi:MAG: hypothetical protein KDB80_04320 [Planctomycetes bacterium]|nr:hypothetical protein [Planctomycetota bacterium]
MRFSIPLAAAALVSVSVAQNVSHPPPATPANHLTQFVTGLDIEANMGGLTALAESNQTVVSMTTTACNPGSVEGTWEANPATNHPLICQMYCRLSNNRFEQINDYSYGKHSFGSTNSNGCGGGCGGAAFNRLGLNCSDTYGSTLNWSRNDLGPLTEWNSWTGEFTFFGSHVDTGYPQTSPDGASSAINPNNQRQFRCRILNNKIGTAGATYYAMAYYMHKWEPEANRENNMASKQISLSVGSASAISAQLHGNILEDRYTGARVESATNEVGGTTYDGRFYVGVHVADNGDGTWRYEYAVHNRDNHAGNVRFVVPCGSTATVTNIGTKDVNLNGWDASDNWTGEHIGNCIVFDPGPGAPPQGWNTIYNFWFDCDAGPTDGTVEIFGDPSRLNPGAGVSVVVASDVPNVAPGAANEDLGEGCGLTLSVTDAASPGATVNLNVSGALPNAAAATHLAFSDVNSFGLVPPFGPVGCTMVSPSLTLGLSIGGSGSGTGTLSVPNTTGMIGVQFHVQAAALAVGGPVLGLAEISNRYRIPVCP